MRRDFSTPPLRKNKKRIFIVGLVIFLCGAWGIATIIHQDSTNKTTSIIKSTQPAFPDVPTKNLTTTQKKILTLVRQEYEKVPRSYDTTVLKYTEGAEESWCADFISWTFLKAGVPVTNPNSDYWRIPGVLTLQQYYRDNTGYVEASSGYTPHLGDIAFYIGAQTPDNSSEEHAAIVLKVNDGNITTIGGNEGSGIMRIRTESLQQNIDKGLVGFGQLKT